MSPRGHVNLTTKLAATLLCLRDGDQMPLIPYEHAKLMSAAQIVSLFQFDHGILHTHDGPDEPWNLTPRMIIPHRIKTATVDVPVAAKVKHLTAAQEEFQRRILAKTYGGMPERKSRWPSRSMRRRKS